MATTASNNDGNEADEREREREEERGCWKMDEAEKERERVGLLQ